MVPERRVIGEKCDVCDCEISTLELYLVLPLCRAWWSQRLKEMGQMQHWLMVTWTSVFAPGPVWGTLYVQFSGPTMFFLDNVVVAKIAEQPVLTLAVVGVVDIACGWWYFPIFIY